MPVEVDWFDDDQTILIQRMQGRWHLDEAFEALSAFDQRLTDREMLRYFIVDLQDAEGMPSGILTMEKRIADIFQPKSFTVVVGAHSAIRLIVNSMTRLGLQADLAFVDTLDDAVVLIAQRRQATTE